MKTRKENWNQKTTELFQKDLLKTRSLDVWGYLGWTLWLYRKQMLNQRSVIKNRRFANQWRQRTVASRNLTQSRVTLRRRNIQRRKHCYFVPLHFRSVRTTAGGSRAMSEQEKIFKWSIPTAGLLNGVVLNVFKQRVKKKQVIETRDSYVMYRLYLDALIENYSDEYAFFPGM